MNNTTILYTSHYIEEVERMADQVMMLDKGKIQLDDAPENIKRNQKLFCNSNSMQISRTYQSTET